MTTKHYRSHWPTGAVVRMCACGTNDWPPAGMVPVFTDGRNEWANCPKCCKTWDMITLREIKEEAKS